MAKARRKPSPTDREANRYDKILKENLLKAIPGLMLLLAGIRIAEMEIVSLELQHTREAKADFLAVVTDAGGRRFVMHLEFQVENDAMMVHRMHDYRCFLRRRFPDLEIFQYVVFLGENPPTMQTTLQEHNLFYRYELYWIQDVNYHHFLASEDAELLPMAFLADFGTTSPQRVAEQVVEKLHERVRGDSELEFLRFTNQLRMLANLRNLRPLIDSIMEKVSRFFVPERDPWFQQGIEQGIEQGIGQGITQATLDIAVNLILASDHDDAFIGRITNLEPETVAAIRDLIRNHPDNFREKLKNIRLLPE